MRRILVDSARRKKAEKRGGGRARADLDTDSLPADGSPFDLLELDDLLEITITRGDKQVVRVRVEAEPSATPAAVKVETGAFVLLAAGTERKLNSLAEAVQGAGDGDTIEIRGNGPFVSSPIKITQSLTIRAGEGFRPVIQLSSNISTISPLVLEGLELQRLGEKVPVGYEEALVFSWDSSSLHLANCRFREHLALPCVVTNARSYFVRNCEFHCPHNSAITWARRLGEGGRPDYLKYSRLLATTITPP